MGVFLLGVTAGRSLCRQMALGGASLHRHPFQIAAWDRATAWWRLGTFRMVAGCTIPTMAWGGPERVPLFQKRSTAWRTGMEVGWLWGMARPSSVARAWKSFYPIRTTVMAISK